MGRKQTSGQEPAGNLRTGLRYALYSVASLSILIAALFLYSRIDQQLAENPRFRLAGPAEEGGESAALKIEGATYTSHARIVRVFSTDFGRSVYLLPLSERRRGLLAIDWVKDATLSRMWPDRLEVRVLERKPVAFVQLPVTGGGPTNEIALIDEEGVILEQPPRARFTLPAVSGIRREQSLGMRRQRVSIALRLVGELGGLATQLSEIDVGDPENVRVVQSVEGRVVVLLLGNRNFLSRLQNFLSHYPEIHRRLPNAANFDLRLDDRITASGEGGRSG